jgi:hypothetical protein
MVFGDYPCCGGELAISIPERTPAYSAESCPHCGAKVWHRLSRIDPQSWTEADFLAEYEVDEGAKTIKERNPVPPAPPMPLELMEAFAKMMEDALLYGESSVEKPAGLLRQLPRGR